MGELWHDLVEMLRKYPLLWLPVLLVDLLCYGLNFGFTALLHTVLVHQVAQHSVLGGSAVNTPLSASAMHSTAIAALLLSWLSNFLRLFLYSGALVMTASLLWKLLAREPKPGAQLGAALGRHLGGMLELALRALAVYAVAALLFSWISGALAKAGHQAVLRNAFSGFAVSLLVLFVQAMLLPPVALRVLAGRSPDAPRAQRARWFAFSLVAVAAVLAAFVTSNTRELAQMSPGARFPMEIIGSLVVALPYVLIFTGMGLLARQIRREADEGVPAD